MHINYNILLPLYRILCRIIKANLSWSWTRAKFLPLNCKFICGSTPT